jgi:hypothetical protein
MNGFALSPRHDAKNGVINGAFVKLDHESLQALANDCGRQAGFE